MNPRPGAARIRALSTLAGLALMFWAPTLAESRDAASIYLLDPQSGTREVLGRGSPLLHVAFFATWCRDCVDELDRLAEIDDRWGDRGYRLVLVAVPSRQTVERLAAFADERSLPGRLAFDESGKLAATLGADHLPTHVLLNSDGVEVGRAESADEIAALVQRNLGDRNRGR